LRQTPTKREIERKANETVTLDEVTRGIELHNGERQLLSCWQDEREHEKGVVLATERRVILAQAAGIESREKHVRTSRIPGKITKSIDYSEITAVRTNYLDPMSSLLRLLSTWLKPIARVDVAMASPLPQVHIHLGESDSIELAISTHRARQLLFLLANQTSLNVPRHWLDLLPWARSRSTTHPSFWVEPTLQEDASRVQLDGAERRVFTCRRQERHPHAGLLLATDRRLILAQSSGVFKIRRRRLFRSPILASQVPGKVLESIDYAHVTRVTGRYLDPLSSVARLVGAPFDLESEARRPVPRVRIHGRGPHRMELATSTVVARELLLLLASHTDLGVPRYWMDRMPWNRGRRGRRRKPRASPGQTERDLAMNATHGPAGPAGTPPPRPRLRDIRSRRERDSR
jgi:hypothetical protein